ncbi:XRE family transcriptional regulator [Streptomyces sp. NPDC003278]|uniref:XRE family transcriptional regulator n=1 Tax=Streptomyces sp. NPDC003278 TaxID=3364679 RepID=UPI0036C1BB75
MYDRTALVSAARSAGDHNPADAARRLRLPRNTAWRLWHGKTAPSAHTLAAVEQAYGLHPSTLLQPATEATT